MSPKLVAHVDLRLEGRKPVFECMGCTATSLGLGAFRIVLPAGRYFTQAICAWPTHVSTIVKIAPNQIDVVLHTPEGKRHIPPLCPISVWIYEEDSGIEVT